MLTLGKKAKDKLTGFGGILTGRAQYLTGCDQYFVSPKAIKSDYKEGVWIDEARLKITGDGVNKRDVMDKKDPGGPSRNAPRY